MFDVYEVPSIWYIIRYITHPEALLLTNTSMFCLSRTRSTERMDYDLVKPKPIENKAETVTSFVVNVNSDINVPSLKKITGL